jgi:hypothetical protein
VNPEGDTLTIASKLLSKYSPSHLPNYELYSNSSFIYQSATCTWSSPAADTYLPGCTSDGCKLYPTLEEAEGACLSMGCGCGGVTYGGVYYTTRAGSSLLVSPYGEISYLKEPFGCGCGVLYSTWTRDIGELSFLCDVDSECAGFSSLGEIVRANSFSGLASAVGSDCYLKK